MVVEEQYSKATLSDESSTGRTSHVYDGSMVSALYFHGIQLQPCTTVLGDTRPIDQGYDLVSMALRKSINPAVEQSDQ